MTIYNGFDINTAATPKPWGTREEQVIKDIIDTLVGDAIGGVKATGGHVHNNLYYDASNTAVTIDGSGNATFIGTVGVNDLDVTTNIDTATMTATGTVGVNDLDVTTNIDTATMTATGTVGVNDLDVTTNIDTATLRTTSTVGIGIATPDGTCHIHTATAGSVSPDAAADDLTIENSGDCGLSILSPDANFSLIAFGSPTDNFGAIARWKQSTALMEIGSANASGQLSLVSGNAAEAVRIDASGNVGIGSTPSYLFDVNKSVAGAYVTRLLNNSSSGDGLLVISGPSSPVGTYTLLNLQDGGSNVRFIVKDNGYLGIGTDSPTTLLDINNDTFRLRTAKVPATAGAAGTTGTIAWGTDGGTSYLYVCIATNTWERVALATW